MVRAMFNVQSVLCNSETWKLISLSHGKSIVGWLRVFTIKISLDNIIDHFKVRLGTKDYT